MKYKNNPEELAKRHTRKRFEGDDPDTVYECPICLEGIALADVATHLRAHDHLPEHLGDQIEGLRHVANQIMSSYASALTKAKRASSKKPKHNDRARRSNLVVCPICKCKTHLINYVDHWSQEHRYQSASTADGRRRVESLYRSSKRMGGRRQRNANPIKIKKGRRINLGKGTGIKIVSGGLPSLGKRR